MKKRLVSLLLVLALLIPMAAFAEEDAVSSASVANFYGDYALTGDDLMNAVNSFSGFYLVSTVNPDGTANSAYFIFAITKYEDKYYLRLGLAENQSKINLEANGCGVAVYAASPSNEEGAKPYAVSGARMTFSKVTDTAVEEALVKESGSDTAMFFEITNVAPLG